MNVSNVGTRHRSGAETFGRGQTAWFPPSALTYAGHNVATAPSNASPVLCSHLPSDVTVARTPTARGLVAANARAGAGLCRSPAAGSGPLAHSSEKQSNQSQVGMSGSRRLGALSLRKEQNGPYLQVHHEFLWYKLGTIDELGEGLGRSPATEFRPMPLQSSGLQAAE